MPDDSGTLLSGRQPRDPWSERSGQAPLRTPEGIRALDPDPQRIDDFSFAHS